MGLVRSFLGFSGRLNRTRFWIAMILFHVAYAVIKPVSIAAVGSGIALFSVPKGMVGFVFGVWAGILICVVLYVDNAIVIKRFHDRNKSGWWAVPYAIATAVPVAGVVLHSWLVALPGVAASLWFLVELGLLPGTRGENRFGPGPLAPKATAVAGPLQLAVQHASPNFERVAPRF